MRPVIFALLLIAPFGAIADPVVHLFETWGQLKDSEKILFYAGWADGFIQGRGPKVVALSSCLNGLSYKQAVAIIDRQYRDHPESWSDAMGAQILGAMTGKEGPCSGLSPF
jgi:hypothetical protein